jgi:ribonuclease Z
MENVLTGFSRAMYANWVWHRSLRLIIDAGEGLPLALGTSVFSPSLVAITHGHSDHVLGLPGLAGARRFSKGAPEKPWTVVYPAASAGVEAMRRTIAELWAGVAFPIVWVPVSPGEKIALGRTRVLEAFAVTHVPPEPALGYRVIETRRRLRPQYIGTAAAEVEREAREHGRDHVMEQFQHVLFAHSGDAMPIEAAWAENADILVHDATFLASADRRVPIHATSEEALQVATSARARVLVLNHLSIRYDRETAIGVLRAQVAASGFTGECWLLDEGQFVGLSNQVRAVP